MEETNMFPFFCLHSQNRQEFAQTTGCFALHLIVTVSQGASGQPGIAIILL